MQSPAYPKHSGGGFEKLLLGLQLVEPGFPRFAPLKNSRELPGRDAPERGLKN